MLAFFRTKQLGNTKTFSTFTAEKQDISFPCCSSLHKRGTRGNGIKAFIEMCFLIIILT